MSQIMFDTENYSGYLEFLVESVDEDSEEIKVKFDSLSDFNDTLSKYYRNDFSFLSEVADTVELTGLTVLGKQDSERFQIDFLEGWKRATIIFDESKFTDIKNDKLDRIKAILKEN